MNRVRIVKHEATFASRIVRQMTFHGSSPKKEEACQALNLEKRRGRALRDGEPAMW